MRINEHDQGDSRATHSCSNSLEKKLLDHSPNVADQRHPGIRISYQSRTSLLLHRYIETRFDDPEITLSSMATTFECSKKHLVRCFRLCFATTPMKYLKRRRLEIAAQMIDSDCESLAHIAYRCGFKSYSQFSNEFKKKFGLTPSQRSKQVKDSPISIISLVTDEREKK